MRCFLSSLQRRLRIVVVGGLAMGLAACAPAFSPPGGREGRLLMLSQCGQCHRVFLPEEYSKEEWEPILKRMLPLVSITPEDRAALKEYIMAAAR